MPNNAVVTRVISSSAPITTTPSTFPFGPLANGNLVANFTSPVIETVGTNDANFTFEFYIPDKNATDGDVLNPTTGGFDTTTNNANGNGNWTPIDSRDTTAPVTSTALPVVTTDKSIATQKSVTNVTDIQNSPGDTLEYTINFQVSDYFSFRDLISKDIFSDGQRFNSTFTLTVTVTDRNGTVSKYT